MSKEDFYNLTPHEVMAAVEASGFNPTGEYVQLNSYENRVFDIRLERRTDADPKSVVVKFYRPHRWSKETITDEHIFLMDLKARDIPAIAPLILPTKESVGVWKNLFFAIFPKGRGRVVDELMPDDFQRIGRTVAQLHNVGSEKVAPHRPRFDMDQYGWSSLQMLEKSIPQELLANYFDAAEDIIEFLDEELEPKSYFRIHGDCHRGNILRTDPVSGPKEYFFVDFDDCCMGPAVQDLWMLLSAPDHTDEADTELEALFNGYNEIRRMKKQELDIIPALRGLRIIYYSAWIARRWEDPVFPKLFPQFTETNYWLSEIESLNEIRSFL